MTTSQLILTDCVSLVLLGITTLLTRATPRRILGALAGGLAAALLNVGEDIGAFSLGWWYYPSVATSYGPPLMYVAVGLWYGAGVALIGWRLTRHFGWRGQAAFISLMSVFGLGRDYAVAAVSGVIVFAPGIKTVVGDVVCWAILLGMAQGVMRLIAGPAKYDRLARTSG